MNGTINPNIAKSPGVGMEATKPPLVENHCCRCSSVSLTLACCSVTKSCPTLCNPTDCSMPGFPVLHCLPANVHWVGDAFQPSHPLLALFLLPSIFPGIRVFPNELALLILSTKYWRFSLIPATMYLITNHTCEYRPSLKCDCSSDLSPKLGLTYCHVKSDLGDLTHASNSTHSKLNLLIPGPLKAASLLGPQYHKQHQTPGNHPLLPSFLSTSTSLPPTHPSNQLLSPVASNFWLLPHPSTASHFQCLLSSKSGDINPSDVFSRIWSS